MTPWIFLYSAVFFEVLGTSSLKLSEGFSKLSYSSLTIILYVISFYLLSQALKTIPIGIAYAIWAGLGTLVVVLIGVVFFGEMLSWLKALLVMLILIGCVGLNVITKT